MCRAHKAILSVLGLRLVLVASSSRFSDTRTWASKETSRTVDGSLVDVKFHVHPGNTSKAKSKDSRKHLHTRHAESERCLKPAMFGRSQDQDPRRRVILSRVVVLHRSKFRGYITTSMKIHIEDVTDLGTVLPRKKLFEFSNQVTKSSQ